MNNLPAITALIVAIGGLATAIAAVIHSLKTHDVATAAQNTADLARAEVADHKTGDHDLPDTSTAQKGTMT